jgi:hypothetical protein
MSEHSLETGVFPTIQVHPIFNGRTVEQFFKWYKSLLSIMEGQSVVMDHFCLALQSLRGTEKALCQCELDLARPKLTATAGIRSEAAENLWYDSVMKLTINLLKDPRSGFKQKEYMGPYMWQINRSKTLYGWTQHHFYLLAFVFAC